MYSILNLEQLITLNGVPNAHGKFYVYKLGRTELADIWYDPNGETILPNPLDLDNLGMGVIYVSNLYDYTVVCCDPYNNELFSRDIYVNSTGEGGNSRLYEGIDPICVNNTLNVISAKKATLSVQDPLYFVEDSPSAVCIGLQETAFSGLPYVENSALGFNGELISGISGSGFHALSANSASLAGSASIADSASLAGSASLANSASISYSAENAGLVTDGWETGSDGRITAYNGTAFSAGKVYSGISPVYVDNENDQIGVSSKDFLANSPLYFTEYSDRVELSISGLPPTPGLMYESGLNYESGKITGYNGSGISAGKVYSGISPITVNNETDTISLDSATLGVQSPLFFVEDSESATVIGLDTAQIQIDIPESANWNETYTVVNNNSGNWNKSADVVNLTTNSAGDTADFVSGFDGTPIIANRLQTGAYQFNSAQNHASRLEFTPENSMFPPINSALTALHYATGAGMMASAGFFRGFYKANELFISRRQGDIDAKTQTIQLTCDPTESYIYGRTNLSAGDYRLESNCVSGRTGENTWRYGPEEDTVVRNASGVIDTVSDNSAAWNSVNDKLDSQIYASDSGMFLTALPADVAYTGWVESSIVSATSGLQPTGNYLSLSDLRFIEV